MPALILKGVRQAIIERARRTSRLLVKHAMKRGIAGLSLNGLGEGGRKRGQIDQFQDEREADAVLSSR